MLEKRPNFLSILSIGMISQIQCHTKKKSKGMQPQNVENNGENIMLTSNTFLKSKLFF